MTFRQAPFLRNQRDFPNDDMQKLTVEIDRAYIDTAIKVNERIIGTFAIGSSIVTGESWYLRGGNQKQQSLRQIFTFTATGNIAHGLTWSSVSMISPNSCGSFTDGTNWYGCFYASSVAIAGQVTFYVTSTNIVVQAGAGAPTITSGIIDLEWISIY